MNYNLKLQLTGDFGCDKKYLIDSPEKAKPPVRRVRKSAGPGTKWPNRQRMKDRFGSHMSATMEEPMLIRVEYPNDKYDLVKPFLFDKLIAKGQVKKFFRSGKWATAEQYQIRRSNVQYDGPERRKIS